MLLDHRQPLRRHTSPALFSKAIKLNRYNRHSFSWCMKNCGFDDVSGKLALFVRISVLPPLPNVVQPLAIVSPPVGRHDQFNGLQSALSVRLSQTGGCQRPGLYVPGMPGTGKTYLKHFPRRHRSFRTALNCFLIARVYHQHLHDRQAWLVVSISQ